MRANFDDIFDHIVTVAIIVILVSVVGLGLASILNGDGDSIDPYQHQRNECLNRGGMIFEDEYGTFQGCMIGRTVVRR